ncbi:MAG: protein kinase [bacterium]
MTRDDKHIGDEETEADPVQVQLPTPGSVVDNRYQVIEGIGEGGFGWVFRVRHILLGQSFAMKILHPRIAADPDWRVRFREEARATSLIGHENIVFVTDFGMCERYGYYFVMEHLEGRSLSDRLREGQLDLQQALRFAIAASSALSAVHDVGIVHCDLKPDNVMLIERPGRNEVWKFLDFGTSTIVTSAIESDLIYGTPAYMAPEQALGLDVDARADQFSLACALYESLTGRLPWRVDVWEDALASERRKHPPKPIHAFRKDCPEKLNDVIQKALSLQRSERYESVEEFVKALCDTIEVDFVPAPDPQDVKGAPQHGFERSPTAPRVAKVVDAGESMVITLGEDSEIDLFAPEVNVVFQSVDRLGREYRRNMLAGCIFIPTERVLPLDHPVRVHVFLQPRNLTISLDGRVVSQTLTGGPAEVGFGVMFTPESQRDLDTWIKAPIVGLELNPRDILTRLKDLDLSDELSSSQAFLVTMLNEPFQVQRLRAICAGLPMDFNEAVATLIQKKYIGITSASGDQVLGESPQPSLAGVSFSVLDVERLLDQADFFERQHNFGAAISTLRRGLEFLPNYSAIHFRLAKLENTFLSRPSEATRLMIRALEIDPGNREYQDYMAGLGTPISDDN